MTGEHSGPGSTLPETCSDLSSSLPRKLKRLHCSVDGMTGYVGARPLLAGLKPASDSGKMVTKDLLMVGILNSPCFWWCLLPWKEDGFS